MEDVHPPLAVEVALDQPPSWWYYGSVIATCVVIFVCAAIVTGYTMSRLSAKRQVIEVDPMDRLGLVTEIPFSTYCQPPEPTCIPGYLQGLTMISRAQFYDVPELQPVVLDPKPGESGGSRSHGVRDLESPARPSARSHKVKLVQAKKVIPKRQLKPKRRRRNEDD